MNKLTGHFKVMIWIRTQRASRKGKAADKIQESEVRWVECLINHLPRRMKFIGQTGVLFNSSKMVWATHWLRMKEAWSRDKVKLDKRWRNNVGHVWKQGTMILKIMMYRSILRYHRRRKILKKNWITIQVICCSSCRSMKKLKSQIFWNLTKKHLIYSKLNVNKMFKTP